MTVLTTERQAALRRAAYDIATGFSVGFTGVRRGALTSLIEGALTGAFLDGAEAGVKAMRESLREGR